MKNINLMLIAMLVFSVIPPAFAGDHGKAPPPDNPHVDVRNSSDSRAGAVSGASADVVTTATGGAGGSATAEGGNSVSTSIADGGHAGASAEANGRQAVSANDNSIYMVMPSLIVQECGAGINAGAASNGDAGFLGLVWTTANCYALKSGSSFAGIGDYESACVLWYDVNRKAFKRQKYKPDCHFIAERIYESQAAKLATSASPVDLNRYVTREELQIYLDRTFKQSVSK